MDINRIKTLIANITENLQDCGVGELLFMHHVSLSTLDVLSDDDEEVLGYCQALEQSIYNEITRRIDSGEIDITDPQDLYSRLKQYYTNAENSKFGMEIKASFLNMRKKKGKKGAISDLQEGKLGKEFFDRYKKEMGIKDPKPKRGAPKVPSPDSIINGKPPPDVPNN